VKAVRVPADFAQRLRAREPMVGYWVVSESAAIAERVGGLGYDYVCLDMQHGLLDYTSTLHGIVAVDAAGGAAVVRVPGHDASAIGRALDAGARGVIVPLVDSAEEAAAAVVACRYPPIGRRSFGPTRSSLRIGPDLREADAAVACIVMIETADGLAHASEICATPGLDAVYVGPNDLAISLGIIPSSERRTNAEFDAALGTILAAAADAGVAVGIHTDSGEEAAWALTRGFTYASISCDIDHVTAFAAEQYRRAIAPGASS
jgi:4-hydroxy-2-oxoheptanedioate aldolase